MARRHQRDMAVRSALALRQQFTVHGDVLERVEVFRYLGRLLSQDDDDIQAVRSQICKARETWARTGQVLCKENAPPQVSAKFYKAIVQSVLLYDSETWVLSTASLARLKGFHLRAAYRMAKKHVPRRGLHQQWVYPPSDKVLEECGMHTFEHYIDVRKETIAKYVVDRSILAECQGADRRRGSMPWRVVVGAEDVLGRRLMHLNLAIEPFCSSLEPSGHRGTHCRGVVDALGLSVMWYCHTCGLTVWGGTTGGWRKGSNCVDP